MLFITLNLFYTTCLTRLFGSQHELFQNIPIKIGTLHTVEALRSPIVPAEATLVFFRGGGRTCDLSLVVMLTK